MLGEAPVPVDRVMQMTVASLKAAAYAFCIVNSKLRQPSCLRLRYLLQGDIALNIMLPKENTRGYAGG